MHNCYVVPDTSPLCKHFLQRHIYRPTFCSNMYTFMTIFHCHSLWTVLKYLPLGLSLMNRFPFCTDSFLSSALITICSPCIVLELHSLPCSGCVCIYIYIYTWWVWRSHCKNVGYIYLSIVVSVATETTTDESKITQTFSRYRLDS